MDEQQKQEVVMQDAEREAIFKEAYGQATGKSVDEPVAPAQEVAAKEEEPAKEAPPPENDEWKGVSPKLKEQFQAMQARMGDIDTLHNRLRQAEGRLGQQNDFIKRMQAQPKEEKVEKPSLEQIKEALKNDKAWEDLREDYPEWSEQMYQVKTELTRLPTEFDGKLSALDQTIQDKMEGIRREMAIEAVRAVHPDLDEIKSNQAFVSWVNSQPQTIHEKINSWKPSDAISVINDFKKSQQASPSAVIEDRQARLKNAAADTRQTSGKPIKQKSEADMTDEEYRKFIFKKAYQEMR